LSFEGMKTTRRRTSHCGVLFGWWCLQWRIRRKKEEGEEEERKTKKSKKLVVATTSLRAITPLPTSSKAQN